MLQILEVLCFVVHSDIQKRILILWMQMCFGFFYQQCIIDFQRIIFASIDKVT